MQEGTGKGQEGTGKANVQVNSRGKWHQRGPGGSLCLEVAGLSKSSPGSEAEGGGDSTKPGEDTWLSSEV